MDEADLLAPLQEANSESPTDPPNISPEEQAEYDRFFDEATFEDVKEIADILGVTYQDHCEATRLKKYPDPEPNDANIDEIIRLVSEDSSACKEINFNNIQVRRG